MTKSREDTSTRVIRSLARALRRQGYERQTMDGYATAYVPIGDEYGTCEIILDTRTVGSANIAVRNPGDNPAHATVKSVLARHGVNPPTHSGEEGTIVYRISA